MIQQIKGAMEPDYIEGQVNEEIGLVKGIIPEVMSFLLETYGNISPTVLNEKREETLSIYLCTRDCRSRRQTDVGGKNNFWNPIGTEGGW